MDISEAPRRAGEGRPEPGGTSVKGKKVVWVGASASKEGECRLSGSKGTSWWHWAQRKGRPCPPGLEHVGSEYKPL